MTMNPEIRDEWADALESDEYKQAYGALCAISDEHEVIGFCCLGVLSEIAARHGIVVTREIRWTEINDVATAGSVYIRAYVNPEDAGTPDEHIRRGTMYLPPAVTKWAGLQANNPLAILDDDDPVLAEVGSAWPETGNGRTLAHLNDRHVPFTEIARIIRKYL